MWRFLAAFAALALCACMAGPQGETDPTIARTETGAVHGVQSGDVIAFKGVPYAAPPVGDLRWRAPKPAAKWEGVRDASAYGPICMQKMPNPDNGIGQYPASEDCLTLNIFTQGRPTQSNGAKRPVMLWIHGGGFVNGSGSAELYDGTQLARRGVVVVSINYRLGRFGSFAHPLLSKEAAGGLVANYGMMDMIASLDWVKGNIAAFGGDPGNVTIFGESAGGMAVNRLMISPNARGLFKKAIVESGAGRESVLYLDKPGPRGLPSAESDGEAFVKSLGVSATNTAALRAIPADRIIAAGDPSTFTGGGPIIDSKLFPMSVADAFRQGKEAQVPYLVGYNSAEFPSKLADVDGSLTRILGMKLADLPQVAATYPDKDTMAAQIVGDIVFGEPARYLAGQHAAHGQPTYLYRFDVVSVSRRDRLKGTTHAQERQYVFDTLHTSPYPTDENDKVQAKHAGAYWTAFAKTGDPNGSGEPAWPKYSSTKDELLEFTNDGPVGKPSPHKDRWDAIAGRYP